MTYTSNPNMKIRFFRWWYRKAIKEGEFNYLYNTTHLLGFEETAAIFWITRNIK